MSPASSSHSDGKVEADRSSVTVWVHNGSAYHIRLWSRSCKFLYCVCSLLLYHRACRTTSHFTQAFHDCNNFFFSLPYYVSCLFCCLPPVLSIRTADEQLHSIVIQQCSFVVYMGCNFTKTIHRLFHPYTQININYYKLILGYREQSCSDLSSWSLFLIIIFFLLPGVFLDF